MIRVSEEAKRLLGSLSTPDGEVLRLIPRSSEADGLVGGRVYRHGRGEGADQIVQHEGRQALRIERSVRKSFDGSSVEVVGGNLSVAPPSPRTTAPAASFADRSGARNVGGSARTPARARERGRSA